MTQPAIATIRHPRLWREYFPPVARLQLVVVAALLITVYWTPINRDLVWRWLNDGNWSHGPLVPVFSLYFLVTRREELFRIRPKASYFGALLLVFALVMYFMRCWRLRMAYPQAFSIVVAIAGVVLLFGGWGIMRLAWFPVAYLLFAVPLPQHYYVMLTMPLWVFASFVAARIMPIFAPGLEAKAQGVTIDYLYQGNVGNLNMAEACSGLRLMVAFMALGVAMAYLGSRPNWQRIVMCISTIPIAVFCNTIRVTVTGLFMVYGRGDLAQGTPHQLLGIFMLVIALALFALLGYVLSNLFVEEPDQGVVKTATERT